MKVKVLLVEDKKESSNDLDQYISENHRINLIGRADSKALVRDFLKNDEVDIVVLDFEPGNQNFNGTELAREIKKVSSAKIIVITALDEIQRDIIRVGISGYVHKNQIDSIGMVVQDVYENHYPYEEIFNDYNKYRMMAELAVLTSAEKTILKFLLEEDSISKISINCHTSENTVKKQINSIYRKLNIRGAPGMPRDMLMEKYSEALSFL